jgi:hypothetical protein
VFAALLAGDDEIDDALDERVHVEPVLPVLLDGELVATTSSTPTTRLASPAIATP